MDKELLILQKKKKAYVVLKSITAQEYNYYVNQLNTIKERIEVIKRGDNSIDGA